MVEQQRAKRGTQGWPPQLPREDSASFGIVVLVEELRPLVEVPVARGAFYVLAKVAANADSMEVATRMIRERRVAAVCRARPSG